MSSAPSQTYAPSVNLSSRVTLPTGNKDVERLLLWRDPKASAAIVGGATLFYGLFALSNISIAQLFATISLIAVVVILVWSQAGAWFKSAGPPVPKLLREGISQDEARIYADKVRGPVNEALALIGRVLSGKDFKLSGLVIGALLLARTAFGFISVLTLSYTVLLLAFTLPKLYEVRKSDADRVLSLIQNKYNEAYAKFDEKVASRIPSQAKKAE